MAGDDDKKYYKNPEHTNEGLIREMAERKRATGPVERKSNEFELDPVKGEPVNLELEKRMAEASRLAEEENAERKKTLHDPKKFEELMKERLAQTQPADVQRMTNPEIEALRVSGLRSNSDQVRAKQKMNAFMQNIASAIGGMFSGGSASSKSTMCDNYGHIAPARWRGDFPKCTECGRLITSQNELRGSSATQKTSDIKPHDNRLEL